MLRRTLAAVAAALLLAPAAGAQVARYHLDGSGADSSGNGLDGVPQGSPVGVADGRFGSAFRFGTPNAGFAVAANPLLQPALVTLAAWVRASTPPSPVQSIVSQGAQATCSHASYSLYTGGSALPDRGTRFYIHNGVTAFVTPAAPTTMWDGAWHMLAGTYDGSAVRLYLDGQLVGSTPGTGAIGYGLTSNAFVIGNAPPSGCIENTSFNGDIDEVLVFDRALSQAEVQALPPVDPTPVPTPTATPPAPPPPAADSDGDGIPDAQDPFPIAEPPVAGQRVRSLAASGTLQVKLPGQSAFVALQGAASLPVGTVVDARRGALSITAATNAQGATGTAQLAAGIFQIRQRRASAKASAATDLVLRTPSGAARACAPGKKRPKGGVVRTLKVTTAKGLFNTVPAKGSIKGIDASYTVTDTCAGTRTKVTKGRVSVKLGKRTKIVRAGQSYLIRAKLFGAKRSRA
jgi:hypothetical protein